MVVSGADTVASTTALDNLFSDVSRSNAHQNVLSALLDVDPRTHQACEHVMCLQQLLALCFDGSLDASKSRALETLRSPAAGRVSAETRAGSELRSGGTFY